MNSLAQSGDRAEVFTAETTERAEARLQRMQSNTSPVQLVRRLSGREDMTEAVSTLQDGVKSGASLALARAIGDQREVSFSELKLTAAASEYHNNVLDIQAEISKEIKAGGLLAVNVNGETRLVARETQLPIMNSVLGPLHTAFRLPKRSKIEVRSTFHGSRSRSRLSPPRLPHVRRCFFCFFLP